MIFSFAASSWVGDADSWLVGMRIKGGAPNRYKVFCETFLRKRRRERSEVQESGCEREITASWRQMGESEASGRNENEDLGTRRERDMRMGGGVYSRCKMEGGRSAYQGGIGFSTSANHTLLREISCGLHTNTT